ncbi:hypothetical protein QR680_011759 [Steinernema hermaphroditum]|uniref:ATP-dependent DNA helicase n=1 Tax=Steinernema hermaphroditum TaxID=289476 RepID=A0AA39I249_9BILA|nr:hypothetical protein QR680_011759 [Steinernema hermaphroditum]
MIIAGGDWKQTLPIVKEVRNEGVLSYTLKKSTLWQRFVQFHLKTNMRAIDDPAYADLLLKIGQGDAQLDEDQVEIPQQTLKNTEDEVINFVFPYNEDWSNRSILTVTNEKSLQLCEMVLNNHPGEARTYESVDKPYKEPGKKKYNIVATKLNEYVGKQKCCRIGQMLDDYGDGNGRVNECIDRAVEAAQKKKSGLYELTSYNCIHFVCQCRTGVSTCPFDIGHLADKMRQL